MMHVQFKSSWSRAVAAVGLTGDGAERDSVAPLAVRVAGLLTTAVAFELLLVRLARLPLASYDRPVLALEQFRRFGSADPAGAIATLGLVTGLLVIGRTRSLGPGWAELEHGGRLRVLVTATAAVLAWSFATYDYNFYFDRGYPIDRLLLIGLAGAIASRPIFVFPFLVVLLPTIAQFEQPIGGFSWADPILPIRVLFLFAAFWLGRRATRRLRTADFVFLLCCLVAAHYWESGLGKLELGWIGRDRIGYLLPATYANGWVAFLSEERVSELTRALLAANAPLKAATLALECGALLALWRLNGLRLLLIGWIGMHAGIFLLTGILFWKWMLLDATLLILFFGRAAPDLSIFTRPHLVLSLVLIGGGTLWFRPPRLAWLDARATYTYRLEAHAASGRTYNLEPRFFAPYDYQFTLGSFRYLSAEPVLSVTWGASEQPSLIEALRYTDTPAELLELEARVGRRTYDAGRGARFDRLVADFVAGWQTRRGDRGWWSVLQPPPLLWTFRRGPPPDPADRILRVEVHQVLSHFDGSNYLEVRSRPVRTIPIPPSPRRVPS